MLYLDKRRIQQVLLNLLNNAIKFQESGIINVFSDLKFDKGQLMVQITVRDNGKGMTQEEVERVFEPFSSKRSSLSQQQASNGVGLSICKRICKQLGGDIEVVSSPDLGSCFKFSVMAKSGVNINLQKDRKLMESVASSISLTFDPLDVNDFYNQRLSLSSD